MAQPAYKITSKISMSLSMSKMLIIIAIIAMLVSSQQTNDHSGSDHTHNQHHHNHEHHHFNHNSHAQSQNVDQTQKRAKPLHSLKMIETRPHLMQTLSLTPITVFFYGSSSTPEYNQFTQTIPAYNDQFHSTTETPIQFVFIPAEKFNLSRPNPSLSIYRKIHHGEWLMYKGVYQKGQMFNWIKNNVVDPLKQLTAEQIDEMLVDGKRGFILVDFGQFYLIKTKIMLKQFCTKFELKCGKVSYSNKALNLVIQLMQIQNEPGVPKLGYWNPKSQQLQIYTKDVGNISENELMQLYSGHESVIPYEAQLDVAKVIHPQTDILQVNQRSDKGIDLDL